MSENEIELEVQARVKFKMNEFLTGLDNLGKIYWHNAFMSGDPKYVHYNDAIGQVRGMLNKETEIAVPYDEMHAMEQRRKRDKAVERIMERIDIRGRVRDTYQIERFIAQEIEKIQK